MTLNAEVTKIIKNKKEMKRKKILGLAIAATLGLELLATASETTLADTTSINSQQFSGIQYRVMTAVPSELPTDPIVGAPGSPNQFDHFYSPGYISGGSPSHHSHHSKKKPRKGHKH